MIEARACRLVFVLVLVLARPLVAAAQLPTARAESVGMSGARLGRIRGAMQGFVDRGDQAGVAWLVARNGKIVERGAIGMQDVAHKLPMRADTIVRMASMTKPITAAAIMMLVDEGRLSLTDPVGKYIPALHDLKVADKSGKAVPTQREITIRDLLTHRAGFTYGFFAGPISETYRKLGISDGLGPDELPLDENIERLARAPLVDQPGHDFHYGLSYDVLGRVIEVVSGKRLDQFFDERIFKPLRMNDSSFSVADDKQARFATVYIGDDKGLHPAADPDKVDRLVFSPNAHYRAPRLMSGGAGVVSTAGDYARFLQMLLGGGALDGVRVLSPKAVELMTVSHSRDLPHELGDDGHDIGLGFAIVMDLGATQQLGSIGMYTWAGAFGTHFFVDPKEKLVAVVLTQRPAYHGPLAETFQTLVYAAIERAP